MSLVSQKTHIVHCKPPLKTYCIYVEYTTRHCHKSKMVFNFLVLSLVNVAPSEMQVADFF